VLRASGLSGGGTPTLNRKAAEKQTGKSHTPQSLPTTVALSTPGSFGSRPANRLNGGEPMLGEVFETLDEFVSEAA
jgi:hypothetical protein